MGNCHRIFTGEGFIFYENNTKEDRLSLPEAIEKGSSYRIGTKTAQDMEPKRSESTTTTITPPTPRQVTRKPKAKGAQTKG
jgi:hypothetical protein